MPAIIGVWELQSFIVTADGNVEKPFGDDPVGLLVFSHPEDGAPYMGAQLASRPGGNAPPRAPIFSFGARFELLSDDSYQFTPIATNNPKKFPIGVATPPKTYRILSQGQIFEESWEEKGKSMVVTWRRLHDGGE